MNSNYLNANNSTNYQFLFIASNFEVDKVELELSECVSCDADSGMCDFSRQDMAMGVSGQELHVYGGYSKGYALHDVLIFSLGRNLFSI